MENRENRFSTLLIYGATKTGKTREVGAMALRIWKKYKKRTRYISADGGGWDPIQDYVDAGMIEPLNISDATTPLTALRMLARGDWPFVQKFEGKPSTTEWMSRSKDGRWDGVGMYAIEGLSSICQLILRDQVEKGRNISGEPAAKFTEKDSESGVSFTFGAPSKAYYGFAQQVLLDLIRDFQGLTKYGVGQILFTSLETSGEDDISRQRILGPASAGKALTATLPQRVGDLIHLDTVSVQQPGKPATEEYRAYFQPHIDPDLNRAWPASMRLGPEALAEFRKNPDLAKGYLVLNDHGVEREGISRIFRWRDEMLAGGAEKLRRLMEGGERG